MGGRRLCSSNRPTVFGRAGWDVEASLAAGGQHIQPAAVSPLPSPLILLLLLLSPLRCCILVVHCSPPPSLASKQPHTNRPRSLACVCLFKSRRSNTHTTLLRKTVGAPRPLLEQLRKRSAHLLCCSLPLTPPSAHPLLRYPLPALLPSLLRHRLHHHLTVTHTHSFSPGCERAFLFSPRTRLIPAHLFHDLCCCKDGRRCERSFIEAQWTRQWRS